MHNSTPLSSQLQSKPWDTALQLSHPWTTDMLPLARRRIGPTVEPAPKLFPSQPRLKKITRYNLHAGCGRRTKSAIWKHEAPSPRSCEGAELRRRGGDDWVDNERSCKAYSLEDRGTRSGRL
ncbi:hypothetical protein K402DRAFT_390641 [Aulographum hederae CBS 113979]|uniref:Uncharacterized protein n=1 Tax=Aulographum hederae CBS 113979 TaxID=1176131 RepID=A0A6G1H9I2_9PEZI|nr:hypothetical protein K402DRAFT_390641 [Aulographum hederae CBS 113979]